jgi:RES domain-containing protein
MARAYRITKRKWAKNAFDGEGARIYGGRWNSQGTRMVYLAGSLSLAVLEMLVHLDDWDGLVREYIYFEVEVPASGIKTASPRTLPKGWANESVTSASQSYGDAWVAKQKSLALRVPSVVVRSEYNFLINPLHPAMSRLTHSDPKRVDFDRRLLPTQRSGA